ncbi:MAG: hypothetical protein DRP18_05030, partial [Candidatus Aenigmatarchaeota archaeon]
MRKCFANKQHFYKAFVLTVLFLLVSVSLISVQKSTAFLIRPFANSTFSADTNLTIWDETDQGMPYADQTKYPNQNITFFANYTNSSSDPVKGSDVSCEIQFNASPYGPFNMTYNSSSSLYEYNRSFPSPGIYSWNVTCNNSQGYENLTTEDTVLVSSPIYYCNSCASCTEYIQNGSLQS